MSKLSAINAKTHKVKGMYENWKNRTLDFADVTRFVDLKVDKNTLMKGIKLSLKILLIAVY